MMKTGQISLVYLMRKILGEVLAFIEENWAKSVGMVKDIIGCPHEEGVDYPEGEQCPECSF